jgi:transposase-like protein
MASKHGPRRDTDKQRFWQARVAKWHRSGLSVREFCRREGVSEPLFYSWRDAMVRTRTGGTRAADRRRTAEPITTALARVPRVARSGMA